MLYRADFHIHSCLSPCASLEMSPSAIVRRAQAVGLDAIALSDHNCGFNLPAFGEICEREGMPCLYGLEATSAEEAHILCLFDQLEAALEWGDRVYESLPNIPNQPDRFGDQPIVNAQEEILGFAEKFLISASVFSVSEMVKQVHALGGLCIPAHIDRRVYGIVSQLGFLPDEPFDAVELTPQGNPSLARDYSIVRNSDSHQLKSIGKSFSQYDVDSLSVTHLRSFLRA
jgi:PHP family Zn ribbon phosphoesterase